MNGGRADQALDFQRSKVETMRAYGAIIHTRLIEGRLLKSAGEPIKPYAYETMGAGRKRIHNFRTKRIHTFRTTISISSIGTRDEFPAKQNIASMQDWKTESGPPQCRRSS
jgi:hypothetical protein